MKAPSKEFQIESMALAFSILLKKCLTQDQFEYVVNMQPINHIPNACYSHNFCDANEVMHEAFKRVMGREIDNDSDEDTELWEAAWSLAKENNFYHTVKK